MTLNMKNWRAWFFFELKTLKHSIICVENNFYPASIKNFNGVIVMKTFVWSKRNQKLHQLEKYKKGIGKILNSAPMFLSFYYDKLKAFCVIKIIPLKW